MLRVRPAEPRSSGLSGRSKPITQDADADAIITRVRPKRSESALAGMIANANMPVVAETESADTAGETWKSSANAGSNACAAYIEMNVDNPAANNATVTVRYPDVPRRSGITSDSITFSTVTTYLQASLTSGKNPPAQTRQKKMHKLGVLYALVVYRLGS